MFSMSPFALDLYGKRVCKITYLSLNAGDPVDAEPGADQRHQGLWGVEGHLHAVGTTSKISPPWNNRSLLFNLYYDEEASIWILKP